MPTTRPILTLDDARRVLDAALGQADRICQPMNVAVVDTGGHLLAFARQDGAIPGSVDIAIRKARTAALLRKATADLAHDVQPGGPLYGLEVTNAGLAVFGGGIPLLHDHHVVGAIGASAGTVEQDVSVAQTGADALTTTSETALGGAERARFGAR